MEYMIWDQSVTWWTYYTITAEDGRPFFAPGPDTYFKLCVDTTGPSIWKFGQPRSLATSTVNKVQRSSARADLKQGPQIGTDSYSSGGFRIEIRYGRLE